jgi:hypothetical protein
MIPSVGALISFGLAAVLFLGSLWMVLEGTLFETGQKPITTYVRANILRYPGRSVTIGMLVVFATGLLTAHFYWDAGCG